jgi:hypothetical protein
MFSDEAPISNNGYRTSLYTDPSIMQGIDFLNNEKQIKNNLSENLFLISQTDGSGLGSGKVVNGKIYEGLTSSQTSSPTDSTPSSTSTSTSTPATDPQKQLETEVKDQLSDKDIDVLKLSYAMVTGIYEELMKEFSKDYEGGIASNTLSSTGEVIPGQRQQLLKEIKSIEVTLGVVGVQVSDIIKERSKVNIQEYYDVMDKIRETKNKIIQTNNKIIELTKMVDPTSAIAQREETHTLSKQRYYMYIFWFIIAAIVIYVMIVNMINPDSSFSLLVVCIIILVCIFGFMFYEKIRSSWYNDIKNGIRNIHIPRIDNVINFDPLVSIKYTS